MVRTYRLSDEISFADYEYTEPYREPPLPREPKASRSAVGQRRTAPKREKVATEVVLPVPVPVVVGKSMLSKRS